MALRFIDSFAHYNATLMYRKWTNPPPFSTLNTSGGRRNAPYLAPGGGFWKTLTPTDNFTIGAAFYVASTNVPALQGIQNGGSLLVYTKVNADYTLAVEGGSSYICVTTRAITQDVWNYIETSFQLSGGLGNLSCTATIRVNEQVWASGTGTLGSTGSNLLFPGNYANQVGVWVGPGGTLGGVQDFYAFDTNTIDINGHTSTNTGFIGDVEIDALFPAADIGTSWSTLGGDGTHAYSCVNETIPDDDTSYVYSSNTSTTGEAFTYQQITGFTGTIFGAQYLACLKKDAEGFRTAGLQVNGGNVASSNFAITTGSNTSTAQYLSDYYVYYIAPLDSANGTAWTTAVYNTCTFGVNVAQ